MSDNKKANEKTDDNVTALPETEKDEKEERAVLRAAFDTTAYDERMAVRRKQIYLIAVFTFAFFALIMVSITNRGIYNINEETLIVINHAFNAIILLLIPFFLGSLGALARALMSGIKASQSMTLIFFSGLMAMFSWVGIKSGVLLSIVAPHLKDKGIEVSATVYTQSDFYTMALVAILVGMFSTNLYIFINQRVEQLTQKATVKNKGSNK